MELHKSSGNHHSFDSPSLEVGAATSKINSVPLPKWAKSRKLSTDHIWKKQLVQFITQISSLVSADFLFSSLLQFYIGHIWNSLIY
jgi:hypothetical protein